MIPFFLFQAQLPLLFTLMTKEPEQGVRATIAVALGDLVVRHPNRLEPWTVSISGLTLIIYIYIYIHIYIYITNT